MNKPFHAGETEVHERYGIRERIDQVGAAVIRDAMPAQHREFFARLPMLLLGSLDASGRPWASVLVGEPGFARAGDDKTLRIAARPAAADPLAVGLSVGSPVGLLGIELETRRRNRMNGTVSALDADGFTVTVDQSFGNCPQYIQARHPDWRGDARAVAESSPVETMEGLLSDAARRLIAGADTLFIASASSGARGNAGADGVDVSHRGGKPGFVRVTTAGGRSVLTMPDFRGNFLFNTLGNIVTRPTAGLLFLDFASGDLLQVTGRAEVIWEGPEVESYAGAQRLLVVTVDLGILHAGALPLRWSPPEYASQLEDTGAWPEAAS
jgi:predicted pyridoxine 5'-phosphate oxidase superfamily flavin-nucleotide-binding protein